MLLKHYLDQGVSKAELSRRFGVNRRTIHYWIETGQLDRDLEAGGPGYSPRPPVVHKLDPYKAIIDARLEAFPKLSAKRLFDEVRADRHRGPSASRPNRRTAIWATAPIMRDRLLAPASTSARARASVPP
ncbi:MAG: hypothetical protein OXE86_08265 [Alphaproteobacteria bacterium]|nr:hypothetical protein [Alphaproteobacteria bacterium]